MKLEPGSPAPAFTLRDQDDNDVSLSDLRGAKTILYFYPRAMTPGCTTQACDFRDNMASLESAGYRVVGISRDAPEKLRSFRERDGLSYTMLSDPENAAHESYGAWGDKMNYGKIVQGVIRSTFVLDENGVITMALYNVKATGHVARLRKLLSVD